MSFTYCQLSPDLLHWLHLATVTWPPSLAPPSRKLKVMLAIYKFTLGRAFYSFSHPDGFKSHSWALFVCLVFNGTSTQDRSICANCRRVKPTQMAKDVQRDRMHNSQYVTQCNTVPKKHSWAQNDSHTMGQVTQVTENLAERSMLLS